MARMGWFHTSLVGKELRRFVTRSERTGGLSVRMCGYKFIYMSGLRRLPLEPGRFITREGEWVMLCYETENSHSSLPLLYIFVHVSGRGRRPETAVTFAERRR